MTEHAFLRAIIDDPAGAAFTWLVFADWLQDRDDPRAELVRLQHDADYCSRLTPRFRDERIRELLSEGVGPLVPTLTNSIGMTFALIPAGSFLMGSPPEEADRSDDELQHEVEITLPFYLATYQVTQAEYERVTGTNPACFSSSGDYKDRLEGLDTQRFPVEQVSWEDATEFCAKLSKLEAEQQGGRTYRLPTEAEWECSCRGGAVLSTPFPIGNSLSSIQANFNGNYPYGSAETGPSLERPSPVGSYPPNAFGLYDMHGNVWEWCQDWFDEKYYSQSTTQLPQGPQDGTERVLRGGSWAADGHCCRAADRDRDVPINRDWYFGFRVVCLFPGL